MVPKTDAARIRAAHGLPRYRIAIRARTSDERVKLYELDRFSVSAELRARLDAEYAQLLVELRARVERLPDWPPHMRLVSS